MVLSIKQGSIYSEASDQLRARRRRRDRFNGLIEQGPKLGFSGEVLLHTFYFSLTPECMQFVQMCAGGDLMEKTLTEAAQLLQKISKGAAMRRDWEKTMFGKLRGRVSSAGACWNFQKRGIESEGRTTEAWESHRDKPR